MPLYYNTSIPTDSTRNTINSVTVGTVTGNDIRDFLLSKNIINPIKYPQKAIFQGTGPLGGEPVLDTFANNGDSVINQLPIESETFRYENNVINNRFVNSDGLPPTFVKIEYQLIESNPDYPTSPNPDNGTTDYYKEDRNKYGILPKSNLLSYREKSTLKNLYVDNTKQVDVSDYIVLQPINTNSQISGGYLDKYGGINLGQGVAVQAANILGSAINGQGIGISNLNGGLSNSFDIRSSLAGRALTAAGILKDTKLGVIGGQQLALALANNAAFNTQKQILGLFDVSTDITNIIQGKGLNGFRKNYTITVPSNTKPLTYVEKVLGFYTPNSFLSSDGSPFSNENGYVTDMQWTNSMLINTGDGQIDSLTANIKANLGLGKNVSNGYNQDDTPFRSGYSPGYTDHKRKFIVNPNGYAFMTTKGDLYPFVNALTTTTGGTTTTNKVIPDLNWNREAIVVDYGFVSPEDGNIHYNVDDGAPFKTNFTWITNNGDALNSNKGGITFQGDLATPSNNKKSLLWKTQLLFNDKGMKNIVSVKGDMGIKKSTQIQTVSSVGGISKGSAVLTNWMFNPKDGSIMKNATGQTADNTFCRAWTPYNRYDSLSKLIRSAGINQAETPGNGNTIQNRWRLNYQGSVLDDNGFVKIVPYKTDKDIDRSGTYGGGIPTSPKKYMFSIENLAWAGQAASNLLPIEQGPGDLLTGKFGRIMWFPPYDLTFSETSNVSLETTNFIGRGEPIYTYNNTERTGNLSFKIFADHSSIMNTFAGKNGPSEDFVRSFLSGCIDLEASWGNKFTYDEMHQVKIKTVTEVPKQQVVKPPIYIFSFYFPNDVYDINYTRNLNDGTLVKFYEHNSKHENKNGDSVDGIGVYAGQEGNNWVDNTNYDFNLGVEGPTGKKYDSVFSPNFISDLNTWLNTEIKDGGCKGCTARISGKASSQTVANNINSQLAQERAKSLNEFITSNFPNVKCKITKTNVGTGNNPYGTYSKDGSTDSQAAKFDRIASVTFTIDPEKIPIEQPKITPINGSIPSSFSNGFLKRFYTELDFFEKLQKGDPANGIPADTFIFDKFREKIRYFHPSFHSITPEGFNSRLTFLLQCTRQGATQNSTGDPQNLAFGQPPVCILRIGDFYNTKIMIDNVTFNFDDNLWDLNPEGIGVQPMITTVNISFKYIGGSTLYGPINKLQNALSFNYFANAQVYDPRADFITKSPDIVVKGETPSDPDTKNQQTAFDAQKYQLNTGLNPLTQSMGKITDAEIEKLFGPSQSDIQPINAQIAANPNTSLTDIQRLELYNLSADTTSWYFNIGRKDLTDDGSLKQDYPLSVNIIDGTNTYNIDLTTYLADDTPLKSNETSQDFSFPFTYLIPNFTGITPNINYTFNVKVGDAGTLTGNYSGDTLINSSSASSSDKAPKIVGFKSYEIHSTLYDYVYTFNVSINTENIYIICGNTITQIISDSELQSFVNKGIKITLENSVNPSDFSESLIINYPVYTPINGDINNGSICTKNCDNPLGQAVGSIGVYLGSPIGSNPTVKLVDGTYVLKLWYNGTIIQKSMVQIPFDGSSQTKYF